MRVGLWTTLRQQYHVPVCQNIPADPVDANVVAAFFAAFSAVELDAYHGALTNRQQGEAARQRAQRQQLQRLRYQAAVAQRQFKHVDPANRLVAAELERRWEHACGMYSRPRRRPSNALSNNPVSWNSRLTSATH